MFDSFIMRAALIISAVITVFAVAKMVCLGLKVANLRKMRRDAGCETPSEEETALHEDILASGVSFLFFIAAPILFSTILLRTCPALVAALDTFFAR